MAIAGDWWMRIARRSGVGYPRPFVRARLSTFASATAGGRGGSVKGAGFADALIVFNAQRGGRAGAVGLVDAKRYASGRSSTRDAVRPAYCVGEASHARHGSQHHRRQACRKLPVAAARAHAVFESTSIASQLRPIVRKYSSSGSET